MRVAAVQAESAWLDLDAGVDKVCAYIKEAASKGCDLIGFPEVFIPGFPHTLYVTPIDPQWILKYQKNSLVVGSSQYRKIQQCAKDNNILQVDSSDLADGSAVLGFSERDGSVLYLAQSFITREGEVALHRRKVKPTSVERYVYGDGQADSIHNTVTEAKTGVKVGGLNCWEHMQPLLRYNSYENGIQVHVASWPYMAYDGPWFTRAQACGDVQSNMVAVEGCAFVLVCTATMNGSGPGNEIMNIKGDLEQSPCGVCADGGGFTCIYGPDGRKIAQAKDQYSEELVIADLDMAAIDEARAAQAKFGSSALDPDLIRLNATPREAPRIHYSDDRHLKTLTERVRELLPDRNRVRTLV